MLLQHLKKSKSWRLWSALFICAALIGSSACSDSGSVSGTIGQRDAGADTSESGVPDADHDTDDEELAEVGEPCAASEECASGRCEEFGEQSVCTTACTDTCDAEGMVCFDDECTPDTFCENDSGVGDGPGCSGSICDQCDENAACDEEGAGSSVCTCNEGYSGDGTTCSDVDECADGTDDCGANATCNNTDGGFTCECKSGYKKDSSGSCVDVNECTDVSASCPANSTCTNTEGSYDCTCEEGYQDDGNGSCVDVDECSNGTASCSTNSICTNTEGSYDCTCEEGYQDDGNGTCVDIDECADGTDNCDANAVCTNTPGGFECACAAGYTGDGLICTTIGITGALSQSDPGQFDDGIYARNCQEYRWPDNDAGYYYTGSTGDGYYTIDPDGTGSVQPFGVYCDMTTDSGGWTAINTYTANHHFGSTLTDPGGHGGCSMNGDSPQGVKADTLTCRYDITTHFDFDTLRTDSVVITALAGSSHVSDLGYVNNNWGTPYCGGSYIGDVLWGTPAQGRAVLSLGAHRGLSPCNNHQTYSDGSALTWTSNVVDTASDNVLRLEFGESGGQTEGWTWTTGRVFVRDSVLISGQLTQSDPGEWEDGTYATSCDDYRYPTKDAAVYGGSTGNGYYTIDPDGPNGAIAPRAALCDMRTDGGGWTRLIAWDRQNNGDTLAELEAQFTEEFNNMGQYENKPSRVRWSDADGTYDALAWRHDIDVPNGGDLLLDYRYEGISMEDSGVYFFAEDASDPHNLACWSDEVDGGQLNNYSTAEQSIMPTYSCPNGMNNVGRNWTWNTQNQYGLGTQLETFRLHSLHADCCVDGGDSSDLYRLNVWVR